MPTYCGKMGKINHLIRIVCGLKQIVFEKKIHFLLVCMPNVSLRNISNSWIFSVSYRQSSHKVICLMNRFCQLRRKDQALNHSLTMLFGI